MNIKKTFFSLFSDDFFPNIFCSHYSCVSGKFVSRVFSTHFWSRYSCEYKETFFALFSDDFIPHHFLLALFLCFWKNCFALFFPSPFFGHGIRVNIKKLFRTFFRRFFPHFLIALFVCFWKNCFASFFPPIFWSRCSCEYKKTFFAVFSDNFFSNYFVRTIRVFLGKLFRAFCSLHFLVTIFV